MATAGTAGPARFALDAVPGHVAVVTPHGVVEHANGLLLEYLGLDTLTHWTERGPIHPEDLPRASESLAESSWGDEIREVEYRLRRFDGRYRWFQSRALAVRDDDGRLRRWHLLLIDSESKRQAERALRRSESLMAAGQRLSLTGTFSWLVAADEIVASEQVYRIFEFEPVVPMTMDLLETRVHPEDLPLFRRSIAAARSTGADFDHEIRLRMANDSVRYLRLMGHATEDAASRLEYIGAVQDVTERRRAEQALHEARSDLAHVARVMSLGVLTASIAHELNQPLAGIIMNATTCLRMLAAELPDIEGARETARRTIRDGNRAAGVIQRLRALFSRKQSTAEAVDLNAAARDAVALTLADLRNNRVLLRQELADELPFVSGDRIELQQVILNLLMNALDAMSRVDDRPRHLLVRTERDGDERIRLTVRDSGVGLDPSSVEDLFAPFYTTKQSGMGIGLSISRSIIESHGGRLWGAPNDGPGASFFFSLLAWPGPSA